MIPVKVFLGQATGTEAEMLGLIYIKKMQIKAFLKTDFK